MKIGISNFAKGRHVPGNGYSFYRHSEQEMIAEILRNWDQRKPGTGRTDLNKVIVVPMDPANFVGNTCVPDETTPLTAFLDQRQPKERPFVRVRATVAEPEPCKYAYVVLYSAEALMENDGERSGDYDWEVVAMVASPVENEPMHPLTMARNFLEEVGGTKCDYTAEQFARAIWYWANRVSIQDVVWRKP